MPSLFPTTIFFYDYTHHVLTVQLKCVCSRGTQTYLVPGSLFKVGHFQFIQQIPDSATILYLDVLNTRITFYFINDGTQDEIFQRKSATSVCYIRFSAGFTYSSSLMMQSHSARSTDKCVFGYIHHPE